MTRLFDRYVLVMLVLGINACSVQLISDYDDVLDKQITALQQSTEEFLAGLIEKQGTPEAGYNANKEFYVSTTASLRTALTRAESQPHSSIISEEIQDMQTTLNDLQKLHQIEGNNGLSLDEIQKSQIALEAEFHSILTLELALKSGTQPTTIATSSGAH